MKLVKPKDNSSLSVFVFDEQILDLQFYSDVFSSEVSVRLSANYTDALSILEESTVFDVYVVDPAAGGFKGFEIIKAIVRVRGRGIPIICMASYATKREELLASKLGAWVFYRKPLIPKIVSPALSILARINSQLSMLKQCSTYQDGAPALVPKLLYLTDSAIESTNFVFPDVVESRIEFANSDLLEVDFQSYDFEPDLIVFDVSIGLDLVSREGSWLWGGQVPLIAAYSKFQPRPVISAIKTFSQSGGLVIDHMSSSFTDSEQARLSAWLNSYCTKYFQTNLRYKKRA